MKKMVEKSTFKLCHLCPCADSEPSRGCRKKLHPAHSMEPIRDTGFWYCPQHDLMSHVRIET